MPELPEVEFTRQLLAPAMVGSRFVRVTARRPDLRYPFPRGFARRLEGQTVRTLTRRAKYLLAELASGDLLVMHLGMSGSFRVLQGVGAAGHRRVAYYHDRGTAGAHDHVVFDMSSGNAVVFNDPRRFGFMTLVEPGTVWGNGAIGPEPLDRRFTAAVLAGALHGRRTSLKAALLDQRVVAGLGNIYVCEALHRAGLSPTRKASTVATRGGAPTAKTVTLVEAIKATLRAAIARHHRPAGDDRFRVYDREGARCPRRGCAGTVARATLAGRSTFFCPVCQR